jgi:CHAT domain-containing protein
MRYGARDRGASDTSEIEFALGAAWSLKNVYYPALARDYLEDAERWSAEPGVDPALRRRVLLEFADFEWEHGSASSASLLLDQADDLASAQGARGSNNDATEVEGRMALLKARIADRQLDDASVVRFVERSVQIATLELRAAARAEFPEYGEIAAGVDQILFEHADGAFCPSCEEALTPIMEAWLGARSAFLEEVGGVDRRGLLLPLTIAVQRSQAEAPLRTHALEAIVKGLNIDPLDGQAVRRDGSQSGDDAIRLAAFESLLARATHQCDEPAIRPMLIERDLEQKRTLAVEIADCVWDSAVEFSAATAALTDLDQLARLLSRAGYGLSGRVLTENLVRLADAEVDGQPVLDHSAQLAAAPVLAAAHARLAEYAYADEDWTGADGHASRAMALARERLSSEWETSSEQAVLLYRTLQPAIRHAAQIRTLVALSPGGGMEGLPERVFADLQLTLLGETGLAGQAAVGRRLLQDPALAKAVNSRDEALRQQQRVDALISAGTADGKAAYAAESEAAARALAEAEAKLVAMGAPDELPSLQPLKLAQAQATLGEGEGLVLLHAGRGQLYGAALAKSGAPRFFVSPIGSLDLEERVAKLRREVASFGAVDLDNAKTLYDFLLAPTESQLGPVNHLIVTGDGPIPGVPWAVLNTADGDLAAQVDRGTAPTRGAVAMQAGTGSPSGDWRDVPWLIRRFPVSVVPGAASLRQRLADSGSGGTRSFLGVGDPLLDGNQPVEAVEVAQLFDRKRGLDTSALARLSPLPETARELQALAQVFGANTADLLLGGNATEHKLAALPLSDYKVVAFATHGILSGEVNGYGEPGLVLTPERSGGDGYLALSEIMALKLDADLVLLSACNTAGSDGRPRSEWMSGLARGFIAVGARQLLVTLWSVPSEPTVRLTTGAARAYARSPELGWPAALRASVLAMIDESPNALDRHPASWAGFVLMGAGSSAAQ